MTWGMEVAVSVLMVSIVLRITILVLRAMFLVMDAFRMLLHVFSVRSIMSMPPMDHVLFVLLATTVLLEIQLVLFAMLLASVAMELPLIVLSVLSTICLLATDQPAFSVLWEPTPLRETHLA